ncbi:MAG: hypothetical protein KTR25_02430 [Myxococcales bacterium]|nr:hypothetical protein [Myxococcales bacterium]
MPEYPLTHSYHTELLNRLLTLLSEATAKDTPLFSQLCSTTNGWCMSRNDWSSRVLADGFSKADTPGYSQLSATTEAGV